MGDSVRTCSYKDNDDSCDHPVYKDGDTCVFHSPDVEGKAVDFKKNIDEYMKKVESDSSIISYNFRSVIFYNIIFEGIKFTKDVDFTQAKFSGYAYFGKAQFLFNAYFNDAKFYGYATFEETQFYNLIYYSQAKFFGEAYFDGAKFYKDTYFNSVRFHENASFIEAQFSGYADFNSTKFSENANFRDVSLFNIIDLKSAIFYGLLDINASNIRFINKLEAKGVNFEGTIIEEANFWGIKKLEGYSFKNSYLLSISFADREIIDCDFTGALFDAVHTRGWKPDEKTINKTKYIYTDYEKYEVYENDKVTKKLRVIEDSRVPASGNFGEGENSKFTLIDFLKDRFKWSRSISVPANVRTAIVNYIQFFTDFMKTVEGIDVEVHTRLEGAKLRVEFETETREDKALIEGHFKEYLKKANDNDVENLDIQFSTKSTATKVEQDILIMDYKNQIRNLQTKLFYTEKLLASEQDKVKLIAQFKENLNQPQIFLESTSTLKQENLFVLKGDIKGFSQYMEQGRGAELSNKFKEIKDMLAQKCLYHEISAGDSILILHKKPLELIKIISRIMEDLSDDFSGNPKLRAAIDFGLTDYFETKQGVKKEVCLILKTVARLEPLVKPDEIWCTDKVIPMFNDSKYIATEITPEDMPINSNIDYKDGRFNIKNKESDPDIWVKLYKITRS